MQIALRPYVSASVGVIGAGLIAITPVVVTPDTEQRAVQLASVDVLADLEGMLSTLGSDISAALGQDTQSAGEILAGLIDPDLAGTPAQAADALAASDLGTGFFTSLSDADSFSTIGGSLLSAADEDANSGDFADARPLDEGASHDASNAATDLSTASSDALSRGAPAGETEKRSTT